MFEPQCARREPSRRRIEITRQPVRKRSVDVPVSLRWAAGLAPGGCSHDFVRSATVDCHGLLNRSHGHADAAACGRQR
jgi:hypothetical protein